MPQITYRLATLADIDQLISLRIAMQSEVGHANPTYWEMLRQELNAYFTTSIPSGDFIAYTAEVDGRIVATSGMVFHQHPPSGGNLNGKEAYIMNMYTLREFRGRGIATELLQSLIQYARERDCSRIILRAQEKARPLYVKAGFEAETSVMQLELE
jgi:GNAT superfamily N-acetyltransferase